MSEATLRSVRRSAVLLLAVVSAAVSSFALAQSASAAPAGPSQCWVSWRPSEGSIRFADTGTTQTLMTIKLKWREEDLTFRTCRSRTAFELETLFGTSKSRHKLKNWDIRSTDLPGGYRDSSQENAEATIGVGKMDDVVADKWYTTKLRFFGRLGQSEFIDVDASRGYRLSPCIGGLSICVSGWRNDDKYGPASRIKIFRGQSVAAQKTYPWRYPTRSTLHNKIVRHPQGGDAHAVDGNGTRHWIPTGAIYNCLVSKGWRVVNSFAALDQRWVINSFPEGARATCDASTPPSAPPPAPPPPAPPPPPPGEPKPYAGNLVVVDYGSGHIGIAFDVGWQAGRDPVTCHTFRDGVEIATDQCGTRSSKQFYGVPAGTHSFYATVSDQFGVYSDPTNTVVQNISSSPPPPPPPQPYAGNLRVVVYGGGHVGVAFDVGWQAGRDPVTCHTFRDNVEVATDQCGTSSSKQFYGVPAGTHSWYATVSDQFGVYRPDQHGHGLQRVSRVLQRVAANRCSQKHSAARATDNAV